MTDRDDPREREEAPEDRIQRERIGVSGDPVPDHEYGDRGRPLGADVDPFEGYPDVSIGVLSIAYHLAVPDIVPFPQAVAWVLHDVEGVEREEAAERMGTSISNVETLLGHARRNIKRARQTASLADGLEATSDE